MNNLPFLPIDICRHLFYVSTNFTEGFLKMTCVSKRRELYDLCDDRLRILALLLPEQFPAPVVFRKG